jgi:bisphosphoglycerate-dependent phosphoglycerate mutase
MAHISLLQSHQRETNYTAGRLRPYVAQEHPRTDYNIEPKSTKEYRNNARYKKQNTNPQQDAHSFKTNLIPKRAEPTSSTNSLRLYYVYGHSSTFKENHLTNKQPGGNKLKQLAHHNSRGNYVKKTNNINDEPITTLYLSIDDPVVGEETERNAVLDEGVLHL